MYEVARVTLDNEMDLILAHKRSMKLAELACLSLSPQTTFATAVSEVARMAIEKDKSACLILGVEIEPRNRYLVASLVSDNEEGLSHPGLTYAKRLVDKYNISTKDKQISIELFYCINPSFRIDINKLDEWRNLFRNEPPVSPYEEIKRKNEQLRELSENNEELKSMQEKLEEAQRVQEKYIDELNRSNQELQQFAFVASHDLQEPVRKLMYYSDYLLHNYSDTVEEKVMEQLMKMRNSAQRMRALIRDLLTFSQIKKDEVKFTDVNLNEVAQNALQDFELAIAERNAEITVDDLPVINGDRQMMEQLFENMISNSLKYAKPDIAPRISISCNQNSDQYDLSFKDNGIGFDEKYLPQMFTLFQRLHGRSSYEGTGLGLAICKKIVDIHQGKIWADAQEGEGATFYVSLLKNAAGN